MSTLLGRRLARLHHAQRVSRADSIMKFSPLSARVSAARSCAISEEPGAVAGERVLRFEDGSALRLGADGHLYPLIVR